MRRALAPVLLLCVPAFACTASNNPEPSTTEAVATAPEPEPETEPVAPPTDDPEPAVDPAPADELQAFAPSRTFTGVMHLPASSQVIRDQKAFDAFVDGIPKKIVTKGPRKHEDSKDPLLAGPSFDWDTEMVIAGVCHSFYCVYDFKGWRMDGEEMVVVARGGEPDEAARYAQRPINPGGGDSVGHYTAIVVPRREGEVRFEESPPPPDPADALPEGLGPTD